MLHVHQTVEGTEPAPADGGHALPVISISLSTDELAEFDRLVGHFKYDSRSSAVRDALHHFIASHRLEFEHEASQVFTLVYPSDKRQEDVHEIVHEESGLIRTSLHNHMGAKCVDVLVVHGPGERVHQLLDRLTRIKDVRVSVAPL